MPETLLIKRWEPRYTILFLMWLVYGCFYLNKLNLAPVIPLIIENLKISHTRIGLISAFFFIFYSCSQFLWGYLSDVFGPRRIVTFGGILSILANFIFSAGTGLFHLAGAQSLNGLGQGAGWGASIKLLNNWFARSARAQVLGIYATSVSIFTIFAYGLSGYIGNTFGWRAAFRVSPVILGFVLLVYWLVVRDYPVVPDNGEIRPRSSHLDGRLDRNRNRLVIIIASSNFRLASAAFACLTFISYTNLFWLPTYLHESHGLNVVKAGLLAGLYPAIGILARPLGGYLSDVTFGGMRKPLILIGFFFILLSSLFLVHTADLRLAMGLILIIGIFEQLIITLFFALSLDTFPKDAAGTGASAMNALGHVGSASAMFFCGLLVDLFHSFKPVFMTLSLLAATGLVVTWFINEKDSRVTPK